MDSKTFTNHLASSLGEDPHRVASLIDEFATILRTSAKNMTTVALPSFGSFVPTKVDEEIITDHSTGRKMLLPPQITVEFHPAAMLRKRLNENE